MPPPPETWICWRRLLVADPWDRDRRLPTNWLILFQIHTTGEKTTQSRRYDSRLHKNMWQPKAWTGQWGRVSEWGSDRPTNIKMGQEWLMFLLLRLSFLCIGLCKQDQATLIFAYLRFAYFAFYRTVQTGSSTPSTTVTTISSAGSMNWPRISR